MPIRVLRLMEYVYDSVETMEKDRGHWQIQGVARPRPGLTVKSVVLPLEVLEGDDNDGS